MDENLMNDGIITLTDEDGNDIDFEIIASCERNGETYFAMIEADEADKENDNGILEYVILKIAVENGEEMLVTVDDDDELDDVADYFDDLFSQEIDYDQQ